MAVYNYKGNLIGNLENAATASLSEYGDLSTAAGFESAFTKAINDNTIDGIEIPRGNYSLNNTLRLRSNFAIIGNGSWLHFYGSNVHCFIISNQSDIVIDGLNIDMHQTKNATSGTTFYISDSDHVTIRNLTIRNIAVRAAMALNADPTSSTNGCNYLTFENLVLNGIGEANSNEPSWPYGILACNARNTIMRHCHVTGMSRVSLAFKNYVKDSMMIDNVIDGSLHGLSVASDRHDDETSSYDVKLIGNTVRNTKYPLWAGRTDRLIVTGNSLTGGQMYIQKCHDTAISGNVMDNSNDPDKQDLIMIDSGTNIVLSGNIYKKHSDGELFNINNSPSNVIVNGLFNGKEINVVNPTSGTPTTA